MPYISQWRVQAVQPVPVDQWSFRKTGRMGTLASQAEVGVGIKAPAALLWGPGI